MKRFVGLLNLHCIVVISDLYQRDLVFFRNQGLFTEILTVKEQEWKMLGTSLAVQCLRLQASTTGGVASTTGWGAVDGGRLSRGEAKKNVYMRCKSIFSSKF